MWHSNTRSKMLYRQMYQRSKYHMPRKYGLSPYVCKSGLSPYVCKSRYLIHTNDFFTHTRFYTVLGIESSCDDTGIAAISMHTKKDHHEIHVIDEIVSSQFDVHSEWKGVVPAMAAREHEKNFPLLLERILQSVRDVSKKETVDAVAVTAGPGLALCLQVGFVAAKYVAHTLQVPLLCINHMEGHALAPLLEDPDIQFPFLSLLVSGGHTMIVLVLDIGHYEILGTTMDDSVGEAFDKTARLCRIGLHQTHLIEDTSCNDDHDDGHPEHLPSQNDCHNNKNDRQQHYQLSNNDCHNKKNDQQHHQSSNSHLDNMNASNDNKQNVENEGSNTKNNSSSLHSLETSPKENQPTAPWWGFLPTKSTRMPDINDPPVKGHYGALLEKLATFGDPFSIPLSVPLSKQLNKMKRSTTQDMYNDHKEKIAFSFSGLKTGVLRASERMDMTNFTNAANLAASFQRVATLHLTQQLQHSLDYCTLLTEQNKIKPVSRILVCGGVASNQYIRDQVVEMAQSQDISTSFPPLKYCTDNGTMIAFAGLQHAMRLNLYVTNNRCTISGESDITRSEDPNHTTRGGLNNTMLEDRSSAMREGLDNTGHENRSDTILENRNNTINIDGPFEFTTTDFTSRWRLGDTQPLPPSGTIVHKRSKRTVGDHSTDLQRLAQDPRLDQCRSILEILKQRRNT